MLPPFAASLTVVAAAAPLLTAGAAFIFVLRVAMTPGRNRTTLRRGPTRHVGVVFPIVEVSEVIDVVHFVDVLRIVLVVAVRDSIFAHVRRQPGF